MCPPCTRHRYAKKKRSKITLEDDAKSKSLSPTIVLNRIRLEKPNDKITVRLQPTLAHYLLETVGDASGWIRKAIVDRLKREA